MLEFLKAEFRDETFVEESKSRMPRFVCVAAPRVGRTVLPRGVARFCELRGLMAAATAEIKADLVGGTGEGLLGFIQLLGDFKQLILCVY